LFGREPAEFDEARFVLMKPQANVARRSRRSAGIFRASASYCEVMAERSRTRGPRLAYGRPRCGAASLFTLRIAERLTLTCASESQSTVDSRTP
jgi:hypothetical protein